MGMEYGEDDFLMISEIQHFEFCRRQWGLIHIEQLWDDNLLTVEGEIMHKRAHDPDFSESRNGVITVRGMPVRSREYGISGICDVVELTRDDENGFEVRGREGKYAVSPVEYKRGRQKEGLEDVMQVVLQALCLEEMLCCRVDAGYLYYGEPRRRQRVQITSELRERARQDINEMHQYYDRKHTPRAKASSKCKSCSLKELCLPGLMKNPSVRDYIEKAVGEES